MENKPTMMNKEWQTFLNKIDWLTDRIEELENRVTLLEEKKEELNYEENPLGLL